MNGNEITTAHIALFIAAMGIVSSVGTALGLFVLQRLFGGGDDLRRKVAALEVEMVKYRSETREHVADKYVTKEDLERVERTVGASIQQLGERMQEYTQAVTAMLGPISNQLLVSPVRMEHRGHGT